MIASLPRSIEHRIPHANSYRHNGEHPRAVVYCSFLPDVPINRQYCAQQLENWKAGRHPTDQWIQPQSILSSSDMNGDDAGDTNDASAAALRTEREAQIEAVLSTPLARRLAGLDPWDERDCSEVE